MGANIGADHGLPGERDGEIAGLSAERRAGGEYEGGREYAGPADGHVRIISESRAMRINAKVASGRYR